MLQARILSFALLCVAMLPWSAPASPQGYPVRSIRLVVPFPAGGPSDFLSRALGQGMSAALGQQIVLENRTGAGGLTGIDSVAKSTPDGYTIGITSGSVLAAMPFMTAKFPFDWRRDLSLLTLVARVHAVLAVHPSLPINTLQELVAYAKNHPRKITFGSSGAGTFTHLVIELLMMQAKIELVHVPYRGAAPAVNDLIGGHIDMVAVDVSALLLAPPLRRDQGACGHIRHALRCLAGRADDQRGWFCGRALGQLVRLDRAGRSAGRSREETPRRGNQHARVG
jgi:tripartite-type tricarboxylate transporter receptor subunit TctC